MNDYDFVEYTPDEEKLIESFLKKRKLEYWRPTLCGDCCGMYENFYSIEYGFTDEFKKEFKKFAEKNNIPYSQEGLNNNYINPREDEEENE